MGGSEEHISPNQLHKSGERYENRSKSLNNHVNQILGWIFWWQRVPHLIAGADEAQRNLSRCRCRCLDFRLFLLLDGGGGGKGGDDRGGGGQGYPWRRNQVPVFCMKTLSLLRTSQLSSSKIGNILSIVSGGKFYQKDGERRGYDPEVFSRIFWEQEEEEERFGQSNISSTGFSIFFHNHNLY